MNEVIIIIGTSIVTSIIIAITIWVILKYHNQQQNTNVQTLTSTSNSLQTKVDNLGNSFENQMIELRGLQQQLLGEQQNTANVFKQFQAIITMKPTSKGRVGEGLVKWVLSQLPQGSWDEQFKIDGGVVDFCIHLSNESDLYLDAKFSFPSEVITNDDYSFTDAKNVLTLNKQATNRAKELIKYNTSKNTKSIGFIMMYMPSVVYVNLNTTTLNHLYSKQIIPVDLSGLLSNILLLKRMIQIVKFNTLQQNILSLVDGIKPLFDKLSSTHATIISQINNANKNLKKLGIDLNESGKNILEQIDIISNSK